MVIVDERDVIGVLPEVGIEATELLLNLEEVLGVVDEGCNLTWGADHARRGENTIHIGGLEVGYH